MNVVDTSGWLEYFADSHNAYFFAPAIEDIENLVVPVITVFEVFKLVWQQPGQNDALQAINVMQDGLVIDVDTSIALGAARISIDEKLPMADAILLVRARLSQAEVWTQDSHYRNIAGVKYIEKPVS